MRAAEVHDLRGLVLVDTEEELKVRGKICRLILDADYGRQDELLPIVDKIVIDRGADAEGDRFQTVPLREALSTHSLNRPNDIHYDSFATLHALTYARTLGRYRDEDYGQPHNKP